MLYFTLVKYEEHNTRMTLLQRASNPSNMDAWEEFSSVYSNFILILLRKFSIPQQECEDITQKVMVRLWKNLDKYDKSRAKFRTWLITIIRNTAITHMTEVSKKTHISADSADLFHLLEDDRQDFIEERYETEWQEYITQLALKNVSGHFRGHAIEVFKLALQGKEIKEIATMLDIKDQTVRNLTNRVKVVIVKEIERLRNELET
ncbi:MAG: RNA polymerase sigma factor [Planctomycetes bacterium]|nr:RNA polymerase sigma factor [Planctomycetota bacterium]